MPVSRATILLTPALALFGPRLLLCAACSAVAMQPATPSPSSAKFHLAVPHVLASVAPSLAALHATRARLLYPSDPSLSGTHCVRCGTSFIANGGETRCVRKKRRKIEGAAVAIRVLRRSCRTCGHEEDVPFGVNGAPDFPKPRDRVRGKPLANRDGELRTE